MTREPQRRRRAISPTLSRTGLVLMRDDEVRTSLAGAPNQLEKGPAGFTHAVSDLQEDLETQESEIAPALAFGPLHKRAFGVAIGTAAGLVVFFLTAMYLLLPPERPFKLGLLGQYFYGYSVTWQGAFIGLAWGFFTGFILGWFTAFCRNLAVAISLFFTFTRAELSETRDFLDHI
ncbi:MAG: hypothetical protein ABR543_11400 [Gemmatimonadaceae bacterium]